MATLPTVIYVSRKKIGCSPCGSEVVMCVDEELTVDGSGLVYGKLYKITESREVCTGKTVYNQWIQYDPAQLVEPTSVLDTCDIENAFCLGCFAKYINYQIAHPIIAGRKVTYPSVAPTVGQKLSVTAVTATTITFGWAS